jgi:hypothetical protein
VARNYRCRDNDHISKIAADNHFQEWQTVWNANPRLQRRRSSPNLLFKGDRRVRRGDLLRIPDPRPREEGAATEAHHPFEVDLQRPTLRLRILKPDFTSLSGARYTARIEGVPDPYQGTTGSNGEIELTIPRNAQRGQLVVRVPAAATDSAPSSGGSAGGAGPAGPGSSGSGGPSASGGGTAGPASSAGAGGTELRGDVPVTWELQIGALNPIMERAPDQNCVSGVQQRLNNLALYTRGVDGRLGSNTQAAIRQFQRIFGITPQSGNPDQAQTQTRLQQVHDSVEGATPPPSSGSSPPSGTGGSAPPSGSTGSAPSSPSGGSAPSAPAGGGLRFF